MNTELSSDIEDVVSEFEEFETRTNLFIQDRLNDFGYRQLQNQAEVVEESLQSADAETGYEELVLEDIRYNLEANTELADFMRRDSDLVADEMLDSLYLDGTFEKLKDEAVSYDDEANYRARELRNQLTLDDPWKYEDEIGVIAKDISDKVEAWAKEEGLMPEEFEFETHLIPQGRDTQRASWRGEIEQVNLPIEHVYVIRNGGGIEYDATNLIFSQFHELVGHGVHQHNSESVDYPQFAAKPSYRLSSLAHSEGVSQHREQYAEQFIDERKEELPVSEIGMELRKMNNTNRDRRELYIQFISEMLEREDIGQEEAEARVAEVLKPEVAELALESQDHSLFEIFQGGSYTAGNMLMKNVDAENQSTEAITTGQWSPEVFPEVVEKIQSVK